MIEQFVGTYGTGSRAAAISKRTLVMVALVVATGCAQKEEASSPEPATPREPAAVVADTSDWIARGNEPFWAVSVTREAIVFREPDRPDGVRGAYAAPTREGTNTVFRTTLEDSVVIALELRIEEKSCSDGMSDQAYDYAAVVRVGDRVMTGCAERHAATSP